MTVAICIPSRNRAHLLGTLIQNIRDTTPEPHTIYMVVADDASARKCERFGIKHWQVPPTATMVQKVNFMARETTEDFFYGGQDDSEFEPGWLTPAINACEDNKGLVAIPEDGSTAILHREYMKLGTIDDPHHILHTGYWHYWSEIEAQDTAKYRDRFTTAPAGAVRHRHYTHGRGGVIDDTYRMNKSRGAQDMRTYMSRCHLFSGREATKWVG